MGEQFEPHPFNAEDQLYMDGPAPQWPGINPQDFQQNEVGQRQYYDAAMGAQLTHEAHSFMAANASASPGTRAERQDENNEAFTSLSQFEQLVNEQRHWVAYKNELKKAPIEEAIRMGIDVERYFAPRDALFVKQFLDFAKEHDYFGADQLSVFPVDQIIHDPQEARRGVFSTDLHAYATGRIGNNSIEATVIDTSTVRTESTDEQPPSNDLYGYVVAKGKLPDLKTSGTWSIYACSDQKIRIGYQPDPTINHAIVAPHEPVFDYFSSSEAKFLAGDKYAYTVRDFITMFTRNMLNEDWQQGFNRKQEEDQYRVSLAQYNHDLQKYNEQLEQVASGGAKASATYEQLIKPEPPKRPNWMSKEAPLGSIAIGPADNKPTDR